MSLIKAAQEKLAAQGIHSVLTQFCDIHGVARGKLVPLSFLSDWVNVGAGFSGPSIWGTGLPRYGSRSEYYGRVQLESLRPLPFMPGVAHAVCDGFAGGTPLETCSRQVLKRQVDALSRRGWKLWVGIEPEFFLLRKASESQWQVGDDQDRLSKPSYDLKSIHRNHGLLDEMRSTLECLGFDLQQIDHEDANGQYEINYRFDDALSAADRYMLFKMAAHAVAEKHGMIFSCMPKPLANAPGSGLHFHLSITDENGTPVFSNADDALGLSNAGYGFAAGLLYHADALSALCAPTVNSYKRLAVSNSLSGTTWSPVWKAMGDNNRTCLVRTVAGRIEWRLPDPSCNVYAAIAATLAAGLNGIDSQMVPAPACSVDLYEQYANGAPMPARLPRDLFEALQGLQADTVLREQIGVAFCDEFLAIKRAEWDAYSQQITAWELDRYARAY
jgi:glutamine synthetase